MTDTNPRAVIGGNGGPDIGPDTVTAPFDDSREEAENWLDGQAVETEAQMDAVDALRKSMRQWRLALEKGQKDASGPLHDAWKAELARWKPTIDDAKRHEDGLVALVDGFKRRLAAEKEAARKAAWEAAEKARKEAETLAALANAGNLEEQRIAAAARDAADLARAQASAAQRDTVKGLRWYDCHEILDMRAAVNWIATHDKDAMRAFTEAYVAKNTAKFPAEIVKTWKEQRAT